MRKLRLASRDSSRSWRRSGAVVLVLSLPLVSSLPLFGASSEPIAVLLEGQRREIVPVVRGDAELVALGSIVQGQGVVVHKDAAGAAMTFTYAGREVAVYHKKSLASVGGELRLLSSPASIEGGECLVPIDAVSRLLAPLLGKPVSWRAPMRVLVVGNVAIPRLGVATFVAGESVRVVIEASEKLPFRVMQHEDKVTVGVARDLVETTFQQERLTGGIVDWVTWVGGRDNLLAIALGRRFAQLKATEQEGPNRLILEFQALATQAARKPGNTQEQAATAAPAPAPPPEISLRTVVIDPGHGGNETGAKGPGGVLEKDVTLAIARKLRAMLTNSLGLQVFLTRDADLEVAHDDRTAVANNYKADVFVSIHANASRSRYARGSEVYFLSYQASDEESRRIAQAEGAFVPEADAAAGSGTDLAFILWDMAQAQHLEQSSTLASRIQEEIAEVTGSQGRGVKQAPFRVLVGAAMPAALVEVAFISHPEEEKLLASDVFQTKVAAALARGITRFRSDPLRRASDGATVTPGR